MRDEFKKDLKGGEGFGSPVDGNEGKESMFNFVPFAGCRRIMSHRDRQVFFIGKLLELFRATSRFLTPLEPPPSAVISNSFLPGESALPLLCHHLLMLSTANSAVS